MVCHNVAFIAIIDFNKKFLCSFIYCVFCHFISSIAIIQILEASPTKSISII